MSHAATNWAFAQRDLRPAEKLLLLCLADRHNPDIGCFPSQERLAEDAGMSRASVNDNLSRLEEKGLLRRERALDPRTRRQRPTRYILGFEDAYAQEPSPETGHGETGTQDEHLPEPSPENGHGAVSRSDLEPCPDQAPSRVQNLDTNPVRITSKFNQGDEERAGDRPDAGARAEFAELVERIAEAVEAPDMADQPYWRDEAVHGHRIAAWRSAGLSDERIVEVARRHAADHPAPPRGPKALDRAMARAAGSIASNGGEARKPASVPERVAFFRDWLASGQYMPPSAMTTTMRGLLISHGVITDAALRERGL